MSTIYLFAKQHNKTGLRYFGKTTRDPQKYHGSGLYWKSHLKEHGRDVTTTWVQAYTDAELASAEAAFFSAVYNIVDSDEWANLIPEDAKGGGSRKGREVPWLTGKKRPDHSSYMTGKMCGENNPMYGKKHSSETIEKLKERAKNRPKRIWVNNGLIEKLVPIDEQIPIGYNRGRVRF